jgi:hypothetical protein
MCCIAAITWTPLYILRRLRNTEMHMYLVYGHILTQITFEELGPVSKLSKELTNICDLLGMCGWLETETRGKFEYYRQTKLSLDIEEWYHEVYNRDEEE